MALVGTVRSGEIYFAVMSDRSMFRNGRFAIRPSGLNGAGPLGSPASFMADNRACLYGAINAAKCAAFAKSVSVPIGVKD
jgi:hypothetical protein